MTIRCKTWDRLILVLLLILLSVSSFGLGHKTGVNSYPAGEHHYGR